MSDSLRAPLFTRGRVMTVGAVAIGLLLLTVVLPRYRAAHRARERAELDEAMAPYLAEAATLTKKLEARFTRVAALDGDAASSCPPEVKGDLPLVQRPWLAYALHPGDSYPKAQSINSPAFDYFVNQAYPGEDLQLLAKRNTLYHALLDAPYVVISAIGSASDIKHTGDATFDGGAIAADLLVVDVAAARVVCRTALASQPDLVVAVKQDDGAFTSNDRQAVVDAFWDAAQ